MSLHIDDVRREFDLLIATINQTQDEKVRQEHVDSLHETLKDMRTGIMMNDENYKRQQKMINEVLPIVMAWWFYQ